MLRFPADHRIFESSMKRLNLIIAAVAFLLCLISIFYGVSIHNANANFPIQHLNEMDNIHYYDVKEVPFLTFKAAVVTFPFILAILIMQFIVVRKARIRQVKNIGVGLFLGMLMLIGFDVLIFFNPGAFEFSKWGFIWGNVISSFIKGNQSTSSQNSEFGN